MNEIDSILLVRNSYVSIAFTGECIILDDEIVI